MQLKALEETVNNLLDDFHSPNMKGKLVVKVSS
jgi:hypothetical protein